MSLFHLFFFFRRNLLLLSTIVIIFTRASDAKLTLECVVDFLKFRHVDDDSFSSVGEFTGDPGTCSDEVKAKIEDFYENARSKMENNLRQKPFAECALKDVQGELYENLLLKALAIELKGVGWKVWKISSKNTRIKDLEDKAQEMLDSALIKCRGYVEYGAFFDTFYEQKRGEEFNEQFDYCMRKHLVDRKQIAANKYNFNSNPKNLKTDGFACEQTMRTAMEQMKSQVSSAGTPCVINIFVDNGYLDLILKIQLLSKLNLTPEEKKLEKQIFIQQMINMTNSIRTCPAA
jgi:hypothetical protein